MIRYSVSILVMICVSCNGAETHFHHSPFAQTDWGGLTPTRVSTGKPKTENDSSFEPRTDIREQMVREAEKLLDRGSESPGYGAEDLEAIFSKVGLEIDWRAGDRLEALVSMAKKKNAFHTETDPEMGDVVLFHNQVDANGNGLVDDWLTGCGVVIDLDNPKFIAIARTGHDPRRVTVWPDGPSRNTVSGEIVNSYLRVPRRSDSKDTVYLAGQLYAGYIDIERLASDQ